MEKEKEMMEIGRIKKKDGMGIEKEGVKIEK